MIEYFGNSLCKRLKKMLLERTAQGEWKEWPSELKKLVDLKWKTEDLQNVEREDVGAIVHHIVVMCSFCP
jgi:hypothetical protein